jgi:hypothetical protein
MIWQAICSCGMKSKAFITSRTMNSDLYMKECLEKRLLPFIRQHNSPVKFWPDLASCHYSAATKNWYLLNGVDVVSVEQNPPNCPEFTLIERYWALVKRIIKKNGGTTKDNKKMLQKWNLHAKKVSETTVRTMMGSIRSRVRNFFRTNV